MDRQRADLLLDPKRLRNDDPKHRRGGYGRDRSPRSRSRIYLISPRGTTVPRQRVRPTLILLLLPISFSYFLPSRSLSYNVRTSLRPRLEPSAPPPPTREPTRSSYVATSPGCTYTYSYASASVLVYRC